MKSQGDLTLEALFEGRPEALRLFQAVRLLVEGLGPVNMVITKTQISFGTERKFAWVWLPQMWVKQGEDSIALTFALDHQVEHPRIAQAVEPYPGRWTHHMVIERESELDGVVREWLSEAYIFGCSRGVKIASARRR